MNLCSEFIRAKNYVGENAEKSVIDFAILVLFLIYSEEYCQYIFLENFQNTFPVYMYLYVYFTAAADVE